MLLIITNKDDLTADFLITKIIDEGKKYFRLNSEDLGSALFNFTASTVEIGRNISVAGKKLNLQEVTCGWYRRKLYPTIPQAITKEQRRFVASEILHLVEGLLWDPNILWVNPLDAAELAERKPYQLRIASEIGFLIPPTVISNDPSVLRRFSQNHHDKVICKAISTGLYQTSDSQYAVYTRRVSSKELTNDLQLQSCPTFLQQEIPKGYDVRVTIIGKEVFPVGIYSKPQMPLDWRLPEQDIDYRLCNIPSDIESRCKSMLERLRLSFGAFDFVCSDKDKWYFMEVNPTGEWAWLEKRLGLPMRQAFLRLFNL